MNNRIKFTPKYDTDFIQKWYFDNIIQGEVFIAGEVKSYMGSTVPNGWLLCDGSEISRNKYNKLFDIIGTSYGSGDDISTFNLPEISDTESVLEYKIIKY